MLAIDLMLIIMMILMIILMIIMTMIMIIMRCGKTWLGGDEEDDDHNQAYDDHVQNLEN